MCGRIRFRGIAYIVIAWLLLTVPFKWLFAFLISCLVHECGHYIALRASKVKVRSWRVGCRGMQLVTAPMGRRKEFICALAGPLVGMLPIFSGSMFPRLAVCAFFHTAYNLLPLRDLDGHRAMKAAASGLFGNKAGEKISDVMNKAAVVLILLAGVWAAFVLRLGVMFLLPGICNIAKLFPVKRPCKVGG